MSEQSGAALDRTQPGAALDCMFKFIIVGAQCGFDLNSLSPAEDFFKVFLRSSMLKCYRLLGNIIYFNEAYFFDVVQASPDLVDGGELVLAALTFTVNF
jgi:hypothetical protein